MADRDDPAGVSSADASGGWQTAAERKAALRRAERRRKRRLVRTGQAVMLVAVLIAVTHMLAHLQAWGGGPPSGLADLLVGYPTAGVLFVVGAILAGQ